MSLQEGFGSLSVSLYTPLIMEPVLYWGLDFIRAVQGASSPPLAAVMKAVTRTGSAPFFFALLPLIFWCVDEKKGIRLGAAVMASIWLNITLKFLFGQPRPFYEGYDPGLALALENLNGFPSGHAQTSLVTWIIIASWIRKKWAWAAAVFVVLLVGFSRLYLGVHFPTDVAGGWLAGALVLAVYFLWGDAVEAALSRGGLRAALVVSAAAAFVMILYNPESAKEMNGGIEAITAPGGAFLGMGAGYALTAHYTAFRSGLGGRAGAAKFIAAAGRIAIGSVGAALVFFIFQKINGVFGADLYRLGIFIRFAVLELWIYAAAPRLFGLCGIAGKHRFPGNAPSPEEPDE
ncbi:MAG: phosphatase PAP2 family protein [Treponema sp.]|jgi:membrane-associated phospholipid phosphatase|nr:phosphatase PAP2 family protein [Treponema sp.]